MADTKISALTAATDLVSAEMAGQQGGVSKRFGIALWNALYQPLLATLTSWGAITRAAGFDTFVATPSSANLAALVTDETGTGALVLAASPALSGTPTAPTAGGGTNTTQIATTAFVTAAVAAIVIDYAGGAAALSVGGIGTYGLLCYTSNTSARSAGFTVAGSNLSFTNVTATAVGATASGTWRLMGALTNLANNPVNTSVWLRIS